MVRVGGCGISVVKTSASKPRSSMISAICSGDNFLRIVVYHCSSHHQADRDSPSAVHVLEARLDCRCACAAGHAIDLERSGGHVRRSWLRFRRSLGAIVNETHLYRRPMEMCCGGARLGEVYYKVMVLRNAIRGIIQVV